MLSDESIKKFEADGYLLINDFASEEEVSSLKDACWRIVEDMDPSAHTKNVFSALSHDHCDDRYFIDSADKVRFFFEKDAMDENGQLKVNKHLALNKIGHALHWHVPEFKRVTFSDKLKGLVKQLGFHSPAVVQSMYIFKQPNFGEEVTPHKDCTFLSMKPQTCIGFWLALEDVTLKNGCLWFSPGSHKTATNRRFIRNPDKEGPITIFNAPPDPHDSSKYVPAEVKKGTMVVINGQVDHRSNKNVSENSRNIYTFHVIERQNATWDAENWLQPTDELPFPGIYETNPE